MSKQKERWQTLEARKGRARRVARLEAVMIWSGENPFAPENVTRLALCYRARQAIPEATFKRWRKQEEAQMLVDHELRKLAEQHGITPASVLGKIAALPDAMKTDSGRIESVKMQARLVGVPVEQQRGKGSVRYQESWTLDDPYEPPQLPAYGTPALPEHDDDDQ